MLHKGWRCLAGFHVLLIVLYNLSALPDHLAPAALRILGDVRTVARQSPAVWYYSQLAGLQGGYGFYSPAVGNLYRTEFGIVEDGEVRYEHDPGLQSPSGRLRYQSFLDIASVWVGSSGQADTRQYAEAVGMSLARRLAVRQAGAAVSLQIITKRVPTLQVLARRTTDRTASYIQLYHYEISAMGD